MNDRVESGRSEWGQGTAGDGLVACPRQNQGMDETTLEGALLEGPLAGLDAGDQAVFLERLRPVVDDLGRLVGRLYPDAESGELVEALVRAAARRFAERPGTLRLLDDERLGKPDWFQRPSMVGYSAYVDRFAGDIPGVIDRIPYLLELGVTYLHLMPFMLAREGENDGGYAVADYLKVDPRFGSDEDFDRLSTALRESGISLCVDVVVNHTADTHEWARRALAGDPAFQSYFRMFPDRDLPDRHEAHLREIFPDTDPGSFTWRPEIERWVWTTFHEYQWDLDYSNPVVLVEMSGVLLDLANRGADVLRIDAPAFLWKELGTMCENLDGAHQVLQVWRILTELACPGVLLLAEAIVPIEDTMRYFGSGDAAGRESQLAYHHFFMVLLWSALAEQNARLLTAALRRAGPIPPGSAWCTYVRSHDDIGWAITPEDAGTVGLDDHLHREFLSDFYTGSYPTSFARGEVFQFNPETLDRRVSGTTASLAGLEQGLDAGDETAVDLAFARMRLLYALVAAHGGIPLVWSGDELALCNDPADPRVDEDSRWIHRPFLDPGDIADRLDPATAAGRMFSVLSEVMAARARSPELHAQVATVPDWSGNDAVFCLVRSGQVGRLVVLANVTASDQTVDAGRLHELGLADGALDRLTGRHRSGDVDLAPYEVVWLVPEATAGRGDLLQH